MAELRPHEARRRTKLGTVVSNKMEKTVVVAVESVRRHPLYGRNVRRMRKFKAHDERNACQVGDQVVIAEARPISKDKRWVVREIVRETIGPGLEVLAEEPALAEPTVTGRATGAMEPAAEDVAGGAAGPAEEPS
jgi:small subunit ribosomal protein S17